MRKKIRVTALLWAVVFGYAAVLSMAQEMAPENRNTSKVGNLPGTMVKSPQGEDIGMITGIVPGPQGRVAFVVLNYWISDDTQRRVAVPFNALSCGEGTCVLNAGRDTLDSAPTFVLDDDLAEPNLAEDIYRYFGIRPYWTEEGPGK
jgi:hypothetical protein